MLYEVITGPGGQDILVMSEPREIDFLALSNFSEVLVRRDIVTGQINRITSYNVCYTKLLRESLLRNEACTSA